MRRKRLFLSSAATCLALALALPIASEAAGDDSARARADALFEQGREAMAHGSYDVACTRFAESQRLDPTIGRAMNLADCEEHRGRLKEALASWAEAVRLGEVNNDDRAAYATERQANLDARVPHLTIRVRSGESDNVTVLLNDVPLDAFQLGARMAVNPGRITIVARAPGRDGRRFTVDLREGQNEVLDVAPGDRVDDSVPPPAASATAVRIAPPPANAPSSPREPVETGDQTLAYVIGGVGAAGMLVAVVTSAMIMSKRRTVDDLCNNVTKKCHDETGRNAAESARSLVPINDVAWAVGLVGLGAGTYLFLTSDGDPGGEAAQNHARGAGLAVGGRF